MRRRCKSRDPLIRLLVAALLALVAPAGLLPATSAQAAVPGGTIADGGGRFSYDSSSASTTAAANACTDATVARSNPPPLSRSSMSSISPRRAAKAGRGIDDVAARAPVGRRASPIEIRPGTNAPGEIAGRPYSGHALDRMQGRGIPPSAVEDAITNGGSVAGRGGTTIHYSPGNHISVVVGRNGRVVTVGYGRFKP